MQTYVTMHEEGGKKKKSGVGGCKRVWPKKNVHSKNEEPSAQKQTFCGSFVWGGGETLYSYLQSFVRASDKPGVAVKERHLS